MDAFPPIILLAPAAFCAALLGALVGALELAYRYKDAPIWAVYRTAAGIYYCLINGFFAFFALLLLYLFDWGVSETDYSPIAKVAADVGIASFGSIAALRSVVMNIKDSNDREITFGVNFLVARLLYLVDREVDRRRSEVRSSDISKMSQGLSVQQVLDVVYPHCQHMMQNVPESEWESVEKIKIEMGYVALDGVDARKALTELYNIMGNGALERAIKDLKAIGALEEGASQKESSTPAQSMIQNLLLNLRGRADRVDVESVGGVIDQPLQEPETAVQEPELPIQESEPSTGFSSTVFSNADANPEGEPAEREPA